VANKEPAPSPAVVQMTEDLVSTSRVLRAPARCHGNLQGRSSNWAAVAGPGNRLAAAARSPLSGVSQSYAAGWMLCTGTQNTTGMDSLHGGRDHQDPENDQYVLNHTSRHTSAFRPGRQPGAGCVAR